MITDKEINQVADDEKQKDWNELRYADIYKDAFVDGAKWARSKVSRMLQERANGGLKKIEEFKPCLSPEHQPPSHIVLSPGKYEYTCPACGEKTVFTVPSITW